MNNILPKNGEAFYMDQFLSHEECDFYLNNLISRIAWRHEEITIFGKKVFQPRLVAFYGDQDKNYTYSQTTMKPCLWTSELLTLKSKIEEISKTTFSSVLLNYYRNGQDSMGWHSDDEKELGKDPIIASLSLGAERDFQFRHRFEKELKLSLKLKSGSLLIMKGETQHFWHHQLPKRLKSQDPRVNLTFRFLL